MLVENVKKSLLSLFDQVWVISLRRRPERLERFFTNIGSTEWPFKHPEAFSAIDGEKVGVPRFWQTGGGSYGCLRSHLSILERAIQEDIDSILIFEDDACFSTDFGSKVVHFFSQVPADWQCVMLGGQHVNSTPIPIAPNVVRAGGGGGIQRTHCYGIRGREAMLELYRTWANAAVHCDWVMGPCMAKFNTYAPDPFLVGQAFGWSDISGQRNPAKFWRPPTGYEPVIILRADRSLMEDLQKIGWHGGYDRDNETGVDSGLKKIAGIKGERERAEELRHWIEMIQWEIASFADPAICTIWHPEITLEMVKPFVRGTLLEICADSVANALSQLPEDIQTQEFRKIPVVILNASRQLMDNLRSHGFHTGHWRDDVSGVDRGVQEAFMSPTSAQLLARIRHVARVLDGEAAGIIGGIATFWHGGVRPEMFSEEEFSVIEISAETVDDAVSQRMEWQQRQSLSRNGTLR